MLYQSIDTQIINQKRDYTPGIQGYDIIYSPMWKCWLILFSLSCDAYGQYRWVFLYFLRSLGVMPSPPPCPIIPIIMIIVLFLGNLSSNFSLSNHVPIALMNSLCVCVSLTVVWVCLSVSVGGVCLLPVSVWAHYVAHWMAINLSVRCSCGLAVSSSQCESPFCLECQMSDFLWVCIRVWGVWLYVYMRVLVCLLCVSCLLLW